MQFERFYSLNDSVAGSFPHIIIYDFSELSHIWGNLCGGNGMHVLPYPIHNCLRCSNTQYMYNMDVGCSLKGSTASTIA